MNTLSRYIIRQFLINFAILTAVIMTLFVLVDVLVDLDEFVAAGQELAPSYGDSQFLAVLAVIADYYLPMLPVLYSYFCGLLVVAAMGFTLTNMVRHREMIALITSGMSMHRIALPLLVVGLGLNLLALPQQELIIPRYVGKLMRSKSQVRKSSIDTFAVSMARDGEGNLISAGRFDAASQSLDDVVILVRSADRSSTSRITARRAQWMGEGWALDDGLQMGMVSADHPEEIVLAEDAQPLDTFTSDLSPSVIMARRARRYPRFLSIAQLDRLANNEALSPAQAARLQQIVWSRFSFIAVNMLLALMALPFIMRRAPTNLLSHCAMAAALVLGAWGGSILLAETTVPMLGPATAAWLPVALCLPVAAWMLMRVET